MDSGRAVFLPSAVEAGKYCQMLVRAGDLVLVKGSRGVKLEKVIELLRNSISYPSGVCSGIPGRMV